MKKVLYIFLLLVSCSFAKEFSSPAAEKSFYREGDVRTLPSDREVIAQIMEGKKGMTFGARSSGCSTRCSTSCSSSCSTSCSSSCSTRCASTPSIYVPSVRPSKTTKKSNTSTRAVTDSSDETPTSTESVVIPHKGKRDIFWDDSEKNVVHNMSCKSFARGEGKPRLKSKLPDCATCGGQSKRPFELGDVKITTINATEN